jgi:uncharacterized linocin/CFP29 family protein
MTNNHWGLTSEQQTRLGWDETAWKGVQEALQIESKRARHVRTMFPLFGHDAINPEAIVDLTISQGPPTFIDPSNPSLVAVELTKQFTIFNEQVGDANVATALVVDAAHDVAAAEDAVFLKATDAAADLTSLGVKERNLSRQTSRLSAKTPPQVQASVLASILAGMAKLQVRGHDGPFQFLGAPDVYARAFRPARNRADAEIISILPLLSEGGFRYCPAAPNGTATLVSNGGGPVYVTVPCDTAVGFVKEDRNITLEIKERVRLLVIDPTAVEQLT